MQNMYTQERYKRQTVLSQIGLNGQKKLAESSVLCVGAGGLGSALLPYLVASGIGKITILDFDKVDITNLQRQVIFNENDVLKPKAKTACLKLKQLNKHVDLNYIESALTAENAEKLVKEHDIIVDASDNFATKYLINDAGFKFGKKVVFGSILGFDGQLSVFDSANGTPCYRCLYKQEPKAVVLNCAQAGVMGALVGIIGSMQAMEVVKLAVAHKDFKPLFGKLLVFNGLNMESNIFKFAKQPNCPTCSKPQSEIVLQSKGLTACLNIKEISIADFKQNIKNYKVLDVREQSECEGGVIKNAYLNPLSLLLQGKLPNLNKEDNIVVYCQSGLRSKQACEILINNNFKNVVSLKGGYNSYIS